MADFWDHSLVDSMKARNRVEWTDGVAKGPISRRLSDLGWRAGAPVSIGVKASCLPPPLIVLIWRKRASLYGLALPARLAYPDHHCCFL